MFPIIESELLELDKEITFVRHETFGNIHGPEEREILKQLPGRLKEHRVDLAIIGVGA
jgi:hypothetical protein